MTSPFLGEFLGTMILVLLGDGVVAGVVLKRSKAEASGWMVITLAGRLAVMAGVFVVHCVREQRCAFESRGHAGLRGARCEFRETRAVSCRADARSNCGSHACVAALIFRTGRKHRMSPAKLACFCTAPAIRSFAANLFSEIVATFVLVFVAGAIFSKSVAATGPAPGLGAYLVGSLVWGIGLSLGGTTGYAINPARDLGPRIAHAILPIAGKGGSDWGYAPIPMIGPLLGGALAGLLLRILAVS